MSRRTTLSAIFQRICTTMILVNVTSHMTITTCTLMHENKMTKTLRAGRFGTCLRIDWMTKIGWLAEQLF